MERKQECPMMIVDDAVYHLRKLQNLCWVISCVQEDSDCRGKDVSDTMFIIWDYLDAQIKALDGIQWSQKKGERA